jgi:hypothetical protein
LIILVASGIDFYFVKIAGIQKKNNGVEGNELKSEETILSGYRKWPIVFFYIIIFSLTLPGLRVYYHKSKKTEYRQLIQEIILNNPNDMPVYAINEWYLNYYFRKYQKPLAHAVNYVPFDQHLKALNEFWMVGIPVKGSELDKKIASDFTLDLKIQKYQIDAGRYKRINR